MASRTTYPPHDSCDVGVALKSSDIPCAAVVAVVAAEVVDEALLHYTTIIESLLTGARVRTFWASVASMRVLSSAYSAIVKVLPLVSLVTSPLGTTRPCHRILGYRARRTSFFRSQRKSRMCSTQADDVRIAALDFGAEVNILRALARCDAVVAVLPLNYDFNAIRWPLFV